MLNFSLMNHETWHKMRLKAKKITIICQVNKVTRLVSPAYKIENFTIVLYYVFQLYTVTPNIVAGIKKADNHPQTSTDPYISISS